eukprot:403365605
MVLDSIGFSNAIFRLNPINLETISYFTGKLGDLGKFSLFMLANYNVIQQVHDLQKVISGDYINLLFQYRFQEYYHLFKHKLNAVMKYGIIMIGEIYLLYHQYFHGIYRLIMVAQLSWIMSEGFAHHQMRNARRVQLNENEKNKIHAWPFVIIFLINSAWMRQAYHMKNDEVLL